MLRPLVFSLALTATAAAAQESDRFTLEPSGDGYVRMDTETGAMSVCERRGTQIVCEMAADERDAFHGEIEGLQDRVADLEKRFEALEGTALKAPTLPSEEEFEKTLGFMERFFRRFMDIVRDFEKTDPPGGAPDRT